MQDSRWIRNYPPLLPGEHDPLYERSAESNDVYEAELEVKGDWVAESGSESEDYGEDGTAVRRCDDDHIPYAMEISPVGWQRHKPINAGRTFNVPYDLQGMVVEPNENDVVDEEHSVVVVFEWEERENRKTTKHKIRGAMAPCELMTVDEWQEWSEKFTSTMTAALQHVYGIEVGDTARFVGKPGRCRHDNMSSGL